MPKLVNVHGYGLVGFPDDMSDQDISHAIENEIVTNRSTDRTLGETAKDIALNIPHAASLATQGIAGIGDIASKINPVNYAIQAGGMAGSKLAGEDAQYQTPSVTKELANVGIDFAEANRAYEEQKSQGLKNAAQNVGTSFNQGLAAGAKSIIENPSYAVEQGVNTLAQMPFVASAAEAKAAQIYEAAGGGAAGKAAVEAAMKQLGKVSSAAEGAQQAGSQASQYSENGTMTNAEAAGAIGSGVGTYVGGRLANRIVPDTEASMAAAKYGVNSIHSLVQKFLNAGKKAAGESVEEALQGPLEQMPTNVAEGKPILQGTGRAAVEGAVTGALAGAGMSTMQQNGQKEDAVQNPVQNQAQPIDQSTAPKPEDFATPQGYSRAYKEWADAQQNEPAMPEPAPAAELPVGEPVTADTGGASVDTNIASSPSEAVDTGTETNAPRQLPVPKQIFADNQATDISQAETMQGQSAPIEEKTPYVGQNISAENPDLANAPSITNNPAFAEQAKSDIASAPKRVRDSLYGILSMPDFIESNGKMTSEIPAEQAANAQTNESFNQGIKDRFVNTVAENPSFAKMASVQNVAQHLGVDLAAVRPMMINNENVSQLSQPALESAYKNSQEGSPQRAVIKAEMSRRMVPKSAVKRKALPLPIRPAPPKAFMQQRAKRNEISKALRENHPELSKHITVLNSPSELKGADKAARGLIRNGRAYVFSDNVEDVHDALRVALHEVVGHKGVNAVLAGKADGVFHSVVNSKDADVAAVVEQVKQEYAKELESRQSTKKKNELIAMETIAKFAEAKKSHPSVIRQAIARLQKILSNIFGNKDFSVYDMKSLLEDAHRHIQKTPAATTSAEDSIGDLYSKKSGKQLSDIINKDKIDKVKNKKALQAAAKVYNRWLTKERGLSKQAQVGKERMAGVMRTANSVIAPFIIKQFDKEIKAAYGVKDLNKRPDIMLEITKALSGKPSNIPDSLKSIVTEMRTFLDSYSGQVQEVLRKNIENLLDKATPESKSLYAQYAKGEITDAELSVAKVEDRDLLNAVIDMQDQINTITANKGQYLNTSYQAHNDPEWKKYAMENKDEIIEPAIKELMDAGYSREKAENYVNDILDNATKIADPNAFMGSAGTLVKTGILKHKQNLSPAFQALLGKYDNPAHAFAASINKMANIVATHEFLSAYKEDAIKAGFVSDQPMGLGWTKLPDSASYGVLRGTYINDEFKQPLLDVINKTQINDIQKAVIHAVALVKAGKTVTSIGTMMVNFLSNHTAALANGHVNPVKFAEAVNLINRFRNGDREALKEMQDMALLGIKDDSVYAAEVKSLQKKEAYARIKNEGKIKKAANAVADVGSSIMSVYEAAYEMGDLVWKISAYKHNLEFAEKHGMSGDVAKAWAAQQVRDKYPTYSNVSKAVDLMKLSPVFSDFPSFAWEASRTVKNLISDIPNIGRQFGKAEAIKRSAYIIAAGAIIPAVAAMISSAAGFDKDDQDKLKKNILPPWMKNSATALGKDANGDLTVTDLGRVTMYGGLIKSILALGNDQYSADQKIGEALKEYFAPFVGVEFTATAFMNALSGVDQFGKPLFSPDAPAYEKALRSVGYLLSTLGPTDLTKTIPNIYKANAPWINAIADKYDMPSIATTGDTPYKKYKVSNELASLAGFRTTTVPVFAALENKAKAQKQNENTEKNLSGLSADLNSISPMSVAKIKEDTKDFLERHDRSWKSTIDTFNALVDSNLMTRNQAASALKAANVKPADIGVIMLGEAPIYSVSKEQPKDMGARLSQAHVPPSAIPGIVSSRMKAMQSVINPYTQERRQEIQDKRKANEKR